MSKIKIYTCVDQIRDYVGLNQIVNYWVDKGFVEKIPIPLLHDLRLIVWVGRVGGLALEPSNVNAISKTTPYEYALTCQYRINWWKDNPRILPWNFYVRDWSAYDKVRHSMPTERKTLSIFSGTIRGKLHQRFSWVGSTEIFSSRPARNFNKTNHLYKSYEDYYRALASTKFGLCPVGDGPVCQREIETMGLGCVPIYTPGVEWNYHVPPQENVHFIFANNPTEMNEKIKSIGDKTREEMVKNGMEYFDKYCSPKGLWDTVLRTIEKYNIKVD
jgi:hypothetical protein